jgi:hypothetical protein
MNIVHTPGGAAIWRERCYAFTKDFQDDLTRMMSRQPHPLAKTLRLEDSSGERHLTGKPKSSHDCRNPAYTAGRHSIDPARSEQRRREWHVSNCHNQACRLAGRDRVAALQWPSRLVTDSVHTEPRPLIDANRGRMIPRVRM